MNELVLITDTLLYQPGDIVTGHVWLNICTPTSGKSLYISLQGTEICERPSADGNTDLFTTDLVWDCNYLLWEAHCAFPFGAYRKEFDLNLPKKLPGSFQCSTLEGWTLTIRYTVKAYVKEDTDLSDTDTIIVSQPAIHDPMTPSVPKKSQTFEVKQFLGLSKAHIQLDCSVQDNFKDMLHTFNSPITFDISIVNTFKTTKIVKRVIKLIQSLSLCGPCVLTESVMHFVGGSNFRRSQGQLPLDNGRPSRLDVTNNQQATTLPHAAKSVSEWQRVLLTENVPDRSCCAVILDLSKCDRKHCLESSVSGTSIKCQYQVVLEVKLDDGEVYTAQPVDIWLNSHSDTLHMPSNTHKLDSLKHEPMFYNAIPIE